MAYNPCMEFTKLDEATPETDIFKPEKLDIKNDDDRAVMIVVRMREAWALDLRRPEDRSRLIEIREEVNYLTTDGQESTGHDDFSELAVRKIVQSAATGFVARNSLLDYDPASVVHRVAHPDRPYDDNALVDPEIRAEVNELLEIDPSLVKLLAARDILIAD